jgi:DeoR/GlpR family transcriptional regulator of sugar metabolism
VGIEEVETTAEVGLHLVLVLAVHVDHVDPPRLPAGRKAGLAAYVAKAGQVNVATLATRFGVSADTIRRDLDRLDADGILIRTHGGAVSLSVMSLISIGAVSAESGYSTSNLAEAVRMSEMTSRASRLAILADSSQSGRQLFAQVAELGRADYFVTDSAPAADLADAVAKHNVKLLIPAD